ncbi:hypothetical protein Tco_0970158 [Tanacetum coccineum]
MNDKSKDTTKAKQDLKTLGIQKELWLGKNQNGKCLKPHAKYSFTPDNRKKFCQFIKGVKLLDRFRSNFKQKVTDNDSNITSRKSHDCHIMMRWLLPYGLQQYLDPNVGTPIIKLFNGVRFVVHSRDKCRTTPNSGICSPNEKEGEMYYGQLEEILEFLYISFKVVTFRVNESFNDQQYILATQVKQVFYLEDMVRRLLHWKVIQDVNYKKFSNKGVIVVKDDHDVIVGMCSYGCCCPKHKQFDYQVNSPCGVAVQVQKLKNLVLKNYGLFLDRDYCHLKQPLIPLPLPIASQAARDAYDMQNEDMLEEHKLLSPKPKIPSPRYGTHIRNTSQGLRGSRRLKNGALSLSMMNLTTLPNSFWGYALKSATRILNMVPTKKVDRTPYKKWRNKAPKLSYLRVWGCEAHEMMGYYFYNPLENKIFVARNAEFFENNLTLQEASGSHGMLEASGSDVGLELIQEDDAQPSKNTSKRHDEIKPNEVESQSGEVPICRSGRISQAPDRYGFYVNAKEHELGDFNEPPNYKLHYQILNLTNGFML